LAIIATTKATKKQQLGHISPQIKTVRTGKG